MRGDQKTRFSGYGGSSYFSHSVCAMVAALEMGVVPQARWMVYVCSCHGKPYQKIWTIFRGTPMTPYDLGNLHIFPFLTHIITIY